MNSKLIVVLGMHRSGTSAITRGLQVLGLQLGDRMMPTIESMNAKGFWEDIDLNALNNEMLQAINSDWFHLTTIESKDIEILRKQGYFVRAVELLRQKVRDFPNFAFKDPRVAKLLPFWKAVFEHCKFDVYYVFAIRNPLSIVKSLLNRDGIVAEQSYLLWLSHVVTSLVDCVGKKIVVVDYDQLMQSPDHELGRIAKNLDLKIDSTELNRYKSEFLDEKLRHTFYDMSDLHLDNTCPDIVKDVYTLLLDLALDKEIFESELIKTKIIGWYNDFNRIQLALNLIDKFFVQYSLLSKTLIERDSHIANLTQATIERDSHIANLTQATIERDSHIVNLTQAATERDAKLNILLIELFEKNNIIDKQLNEKNKLFESVGQAIRIYNR